MQAGQPELRLRDEHVVVRICTAGPSTVTSNNYYSDLKHTDRIFVDRTPVMYSLQEHPQSEFQTQIQADSGCETKQCMKGPSAQGEPKLPTGRRIAHHTADEGWRGEDRG